MREIRVGVVGVGHLGKHHARILSGLPGARLVGVCDNHQESAEAVAAQHQVTAFADPWSLAREVDALVLAVPTSLHHRLGCDLLKAGVHLLIEKPLCRTTAEADELVQCAAASGVKLAVGHVERFNPAVDAAKSHMHQPKYIETCRYSGYTFRSTDIGVVLDLMIHDLDLVLSMVDSHVVKVDAMGVAVLGEREDVANARLTFANGAVASLSASRVSYVAGRTMQVWTSRSFASVDFTSRTATVVTPAAEVLNRTFHADRLTPAERDACKSRLFEDLLRVEKITPEPCDQLTAELTDFLDAVRRNRAPRVDGRAARDAVAVAERILNQIAAQTWDDSSSSSVPGRHAAHSRQLLRGPHWNRTPTEAPAASETPERRS